MCVSSAQCECECVCGMCVSPCRVCVCACVPADLYLLPSRNTLINFVIFLGSFASGIVCHQKTRLKLPCLPPHPLYPSPHHTPLWQSAKSRGTSLRETLLQVGVAREKSHEAVATFLRLPQSLKWKLPPPASSCSFAICLYYFSPRPSSSSSSLVEKAPLARRLVAQLGKPST